MRFNYLFFTNLTYFQLKVKLLCLQLLLGASFILTFRLIKYGFDIGFIPDSKHAHLMSTVTIFVIYAVLVTMFCLSVYKIKCKKCGVAIMFTKSSFPSFRKIRCSNCKADFD